MPYPFHVKMCLLNDEISFEDVRFRVEMRDPWDDEHRSSFDRLVHAWIEACYCGAFCGDHLRRAAETSDRAPTGDDGALGPEVLRNEIGGPEYDERSVTWWAYHFGAGRPAVDALLGMLWVYHVTDRPVATVSVGNLPCLDGS